MDILSNLISIIKNGYLAHKNSVIVGNSKLCVSVLQMLYKLGYISNFSIINKKEIIVLLKYHNNVPCIRGIARVSSPGARRYVKYKKYTRSQG